MVVYTLFLGEAGPEVKDGSEKSSKAYVKLSLLFAQRRNFFIYVQVGGLCRNWLTLKAMVSCRMKYRASDSEE